MHIFPIKVLRGTLANFQTEADTYSSGDMSRLAVQVIEYAIDLDGNPELSAVTITITDVNRGPFHIAYTLSSFEPSLLTLATSNVEQRVEDGDLWGVEGSSRVFKLMDHQVITEQSYEDNASTTSDGGWWESSMLQIGAVAALLVVCCLCGFGIWYCRKRKSYQYNLEWLDQGQSVEIRRDDTVDVSTPIGDGDIAGNATHKVVHSASVVGVEDPFNV